MREHAQPPPALARPRHDVDAVDRGRAAIGREHRVEHAQRGRLAGAVGPKQSGDLAVGRLEADVLDGRHLAEGLVQAAGDDHGRGPAKLTKNGSGPCSSRQPGSSAARSRSRTNSPMSRGMAVTLARSDQVPGVAEVTYGALAERRRRDRVGLAREHQHGDARGERLLEVVVDDAGRPDPARGDHALDDLAAQVAGIEAL